MQGFHCSGLLGRTTLRQKFPLRINIVRPILFRSSRPDYIETKYNEFVFFDTKKLFRSSRPDYIETESPGGRPRLSKLIVPVF